MGFEGHPAGWGPTVSDPERYAVVREAADVLLDELSQGYMVERRAAKEPLGDGALVRTVRLIP